jgi:intraflagellar transport protein 172
MQLRYLENLQNPQDGMQKVTAIAWSPNSQRLAVVGVDKIVQLFDENGERRDRFSTKPADKGQKTYVVKGIAFAPDSTKLAIAQSDSIVFIYKLGTDWADKKCICNKFQQSSSVTAITWPSKHPNEVVFALAEGRVKVGQLKSNKAATLFQSESYVVSLCQGMDGNSVLSGHLDGTVNRFIFATETSAPVTARIARITGCVPYALSAGATVCVAGSDRIVRFFDYDGTELNHFEYDQDPSVKEFSCAAFNPSGESVVLGSCNCFFTYAYYPRTREWREVARKDVPSLFTVTALGWKADGSRLVVGSLCGGIDMFDACIRRTRYRDSFEFTYISLSQVIVKNLTTGSRIILKSNVGCEIQKINVFKDNYLLAHTPESCLLGDLTSCQLSEIPWVTTGAEKFYFESPSMAMIFKAGELSLVEYGSNEVLGCCRTEHMSPHLISVRVGQTTEGVVQKTIAYLLDLQTIRIQDLVSGQAVATISHDVRIDWMELNPLGNRLLFRDKRRQLTMYTVDDQARVTLLNYCNYVQWVPDSDVIVAQNRSQLCVWYSVTAPDRVTIHEIKGDIEEIERSAGRTFVIVDEGANTVEYELDDALINFRGCLDKNAFAQAIDILEELPLTPETEAMWSSLAETSMNGMCLPVAERCYAILGDIAKARYLHKVNKIVREQTEATGIDGRHSYQVQARMAMMAKHFQQAEAILVDQGELDQALAMYQTLHKFDESIRLAERKNHPQVSQLKSHYLNWLITTQQEEKAAAQYEREGQYEKAINLYLKGGMPAKAALVVQYNNANYPQELLQKLAAKLQSSAMQDKAGELFERMGLVQQAMEAYEKGRAYRKAVELAKLHRPQQVVQLEEQWGDWLVSQKQVDAAINHYIEAGNANKAIEAAMSARQWMKAEQLLDSIEPHEAMVFYEKLAAHYANARQYELAERMFCRAGHPELAIKMYIQYNQYEAAHKIGRNNLERNEFTDLYVTLAEELEQNGKLHEAEQLYCAVSEFDLAIHMYKKKEEFEQMLRLVRKHRNELLNETYKHIAEQYEAKGNLKKAEQFYVEGKLWTQAMGMYRQLEKWDDAKRVAKAHGGKAAFEKVVFHHAQAIFAEHGPEAGATLLQKHNLVDMAVDYMLDHNEFSQAYELADHSAKHKLPEVHLKKALALEDDERYKEAADEFIKANKPKEAIDMYIHQRDWTQAMHIAEKYDRSAVDEVMVQQARDYVEHQNNLLAAEELYLRARKPDLAVQMYTQKKMINEAVRICKKHCPRLLSDVIEAYGTLSSGAQTIDDILDAARVYEETGNASKAIDAYLQINDQVTEDADRLEEVWNQAVDLASNSCQERLQDVISIVAKRLAMLGRHASAGDLYEQIDRYQEAIMAYISAEEWVKARNLAKQALPEMLGKVEESYNQDLIQKQNGDELIRRGNVTTALDMYARNGEWDRCLDLAEKSAPKALPHYLTQHCKVLAKDEDFLGACRAFVRYGAPRDPGNYPLYKLICSELCSKKFPTSSEETTMWISLREMLLRVVAGTQVPPPAYNKIDKEVAEFTKSFMVAHLCALRAQARDRGISANIMMKQSVALLRYTADFPVDRAFYDAGIACRDAPVPQPNLAFFYLNRFLDICDAIEDPDSTEIDNSDFLNTDLPTPYEVELPESWWVKADVVEDVRDWVLQGAVDKSVEQKLTTKSCDKCKSEMYVASLQGPCKTMYDPCAVTGYPVMQADKVNCKTCGAAANRDDWNTWIAAFKTCPWCGMSANPFPSPYSAGFYHGYN